MDLQNNRSASPGMLCFDRLSFFMFVFWMKSEWFSLCSKLSLSLSILLFKNSYKCLILENNWFAFHFCSSKNGFTLEWFHLSSNNIIAGIVLASAAYRGQKQFNAVAIITFSHPAPQAQPHWRRSPFICFDPVNNYLPCSCRRRADWKSTRMLCTDSGRERGREERGVEQVLERFVMWEFQQPCVVFPRHSH